MSVHLKDLKWNCEISEFIKCGHINKDCLNKMYLKMY